MQHSPVKLQHYLTTKLTKTVMPSLLMIITFVANTNLTYNTNNTENTAHAISNYNAFFSFNSLFVVTALLEHRAKLLAAV